MSQRGREDAVTSKEGVPKGHVSPHVRQYCRLDVERYGFSSRREVDTPLERLNFEYFE